MSEWKEVELSELIDFGNGKKKPESEGDIPIYGGNGILGFSADSNYENETIIIGRVGAYCGSVYYENRPIWVSDNALAAKAKNGNSTKFIYYFLKNANLNQHAGGSSHPLVTQTLLNSLEYEVCIDQVEQNSIAEVLSSLDDKIDLLHRQNQTLEEIAETLFRQWFVEAIQKIEFEGDQVEGFQFDKFTKWIDGTLGGEWGKENPQGDYSKQVYCIRGTDIADLNTGLPLKIPTRFIKENKFEKIKPEEGDLIIEISGGTETQSTGRVTYINSDVEKLFDLPLVFSNFCRMIKVKKPQYSFFIYCYIQYLYNQDEFFNLENGSSGIKNLDYKALLLELDYPMPEEELVLKFHEAVRPFFKKVNKNKTQIRTLTALRDTLLPKLMSGEVRVEMNATAKMEEA